MGRPRHKKRRRSWDAPVNGGAVVDTGVAISRDSLLKLQTAQTAATPSATRGTAGGGAGGGAGASETAPSRAPAPAQVALDSNTHDKKQSKKKRAKSSHSKVPKNLQPLTAAPLAGDPSLFADRRALPIYNQRDAIFSLAAANRVLILTGATGSGKTTQVPQYLYHCGLAGRGRIVVTQPRRVAAVTVAQRVAAEMGTKVGAKVGYTIRFEDKTSGATKVKFATDGMLLREAQLDPLLSRYTIVVLDEAHERTLATDILFAVIKSALAKRDDLKVVIMSATLDVSLFLGYFGGATLHVPGRQFPVQVRYTSEVQADFIDAALITVLQIHLDEAPGDVLVFLPGQEDIEMLEGLLTRKRPHIPKECMDIKVCPLFASLPRKTQMEAFAPAPKGVRKVILCTNIAETSVTINGVRYVVDAGLVKVRSYAASTGMETLSATEVSKAQAWQRAGRAGREAPGKCFRLYQEKAFRQLRDAAVPEVQRVSLATVALRLLAMGVQRVQDFPFLQPPKRAAVARALEQLVVFRALDRSGKLTKLGERMASLPLSPMYAYTVIKAQELHCTVEIIAIVALLSAENIFYTPREARDKAGKARRKFAATEGDHLTALNVFREYESMNGDAAWCRQHFVNGRSLARAQAIRDQLVEICRKQGVRLESCGKNTTEPIVRALAAGCFLNVARRLPAPDKRTRARYRTEVGGHLVNIHPGSVLFGRPAAPAVVFNELVLTSREYMRFATVIDLEWLPELAPQCYGPTGRAKHQVTASSS